MFDMTKLHVSAIMSAMADAANRQKAYEDARNSYDGYSWGYYGQPYLDAVERAEEEATKVLEQYIAQEVAEQLEKYFASRREPQQ